MLHGGGVERAWMGHGWGRDGTKMTDGNTLSNCGQLRPPRYPGNRRGRLRNSNKWNDEVWT